MRLMGVGEFLLHLFLFVFHFLLAFQDKRELNDLGGEWFPQPSSGCGDASGSVIQKRWSKIERKGVKRMVGEVDGGVRKKV